MSEPSQSSRSYEAEIDSLNNASIESKEMPDVWAWVFLSSRAAIIAHTIYQIAVKKISNDLKNIQKRSLTYQIKGIK